MKTSPSYRELLTRSPAWSSPPPRPDAETRSAQIKRHTGQVRHSEGVDEHRTSIGSHATARKTPHARLQVSKAASLTRPTALSCFAYTDTRGESVRVKEREPSGAQGRCSTRSKTARVAGDAKTIEAVRSAASQRRFPSAETDARLEPMGGFPAYVRM